MWVWPTWCSLYLTLRCHEKWLSPARTIEKCQPWNERKTGGRECNWREKLGVDPPPSPTTPTSYRQLFCNLRQVHPYGETTCLLRTHAYCKTHAYYDMSYHNVRLVSYYKITVYIDPRFSKVDIFQWLLLAMVIWMEIFFFQYNKDVRPYFTLSKWSTRKKLVEVFIFQIYTSFQF